jgi:ubiquinone/menaquinone biosynthesis C-methylase UbiE
MTAPQRAFSHVDESTDDVRAKVVQYLDVAASHPEIQRVRANALELFAPADGEKLLDAGCGLGEIARQLGTIVGSAGSVTALDYSAEALAVAKSRDKEGLVSYTTGDIAKLDFPDDHFDGVRAERVLQHVDDPTAALRELARVTRPGGRVCVIDTDWASLVDDGLDKGQEILQFIIGAGVFKNPAIGRTIRARMIAGGLDAVTTLPVTLRFTSPEDAGKVIPIFSEEGATALPGMVPAELSDAFFPSVQRATGQGVFLVAFTMWITVGQVR